MSINIELMIRQGQYMVTAAALTTQLWIQGTAVKPSPALAKMKSHDSQNKVNIPCTIWGDSSYVCDMWVETVRKALSSIWWELEPELSAVIGSVTNGNDCTTLFYLQKERGLCTSRKGIQLVVQMSLPVITDEEMGSGKVNDLPNVTQLARWETGTHRWHPTEQITHPRHSINVFFKNYSLKVGKDIKDITFTS